MRFRKQDCKISERVWNFDQLLAIWWVLACGLGTVHGPQKGPLWEGEDWSADIAKSSRCGGLDSTRPRSLAVPNIASLGRLSSCHSPRQPCPRPDGL